MIRLSERDVKIQFLIVVFVVLLGGLLFGCGETEPVKPAKFKIGSMVQLKIDGVKGQVVSYYKFDRSYNVRLSRYGEYNKRNFEEFELEKLKK